MHTLQLPRGGRESVPDIFLLRLSIFMEWNNDKSYGLM